MTFESTAFSRTRRRDRGADQAEPGARERGDEDHERERRGSTGREADAEDDAAGGERERRDERGVGDHRQRPPEEEREPPGGADEDRARACSGSARPPIGLRHREQARDRRVLERVADHVELVRLRARPSGRCRRRAGSGRSARRSGSGCRSAARASRRARGSSSARRRRRRDSEVMSARARRARGRRCSTRSMTRKPSAM